MLNCAITNVYNNVYIIYFVSRKMSSYSPTDVTSLKNKLIGTNCMDWKQNLDIVLTIKQFILDYT